MVDVLVRFALSRWDIMYVGIWAIFDIRLASFLIPKKEGFCPCVRSSVRKGRPSGVSDRGEPVDSVAFRSIFQGSAEDKAQPGGGDGLVIICG